MMTNPIIHAVAFIAAVVIPGGLLVYFAWRAYKRRAEANVDHSKPSPAAARKAFLRMYPKESRRARNRRNRIDQFRLAKTRPKKISQ